MNLSWTGSTDAGGVTGYEVERCQGAGCSNFTPLKTVTTTTTSDTGLAASTSYSYRVRAKDAVPNFSGYSNTATATTAGSGGTPGLVAAYGFDEGSGVSVADSSGNGITGAVANGSWSAAGKFGKALSFNGTSSRVTVPDAAALDLTSGDDAGGVGEPGGGADGLEGRHLQGQRQLLPGGVVERRQQAGRGRHHRRQPVAGVRHRPARDGRVGASGRDV